MLFQFTTATVYADIDWMSFTLDNDLFINDDSGYTNGIFLSTYDIGARPEEFPKNDILVTPLMGSMTTNDKIVVVNSYTLGQIMNTPRDITTTNPPDTELPYAGLLFISNTYTVVTPTVADTVGTVIGIVGPASGAETTQKLIHDITGSNDPQGWDTQLENELVFQFSRGRIWRTWVSSSQHFDFLSGADINVGTLTSSVNGGLMLRYGRDLQSTYFTPLFNNLKTANPVAIKGGWYVYGGITASYVFNQIFLDGNTYRDSRSIEYDPDRLGIGIGLAYSWMDYSLTFAINDFDVISDETSEGLTQFGTLTFAWRATP